MVVLPKRCMAVAQEARSTAQRIDFSGCMRASGNTKCEPPPLVARDWSLEFGGFEGNPPLFSQSRYFAPQT